VNFKNNKITDIGNLPAFWPSLERLYLGRRQYIGGALSPIDRSIDETAMCYLDLSICMYVCIWIYLSGTIYLHVCMYVCICIGSNLMSGVPFEIGTCTKLVELDMSYNAIQVSGR